MSTHSLLYSAPQVWLAQTGSILAANWCGTPSVESTRAQVAALVAFARRAAEPLRILTIIDQGTPLADEATRSVINEGVAQINDRIARQALTIEGRGFTSSAMRAMVAGMSLVSRPSHPVKVFSEVSSAVAWCAQGESASEVRAIEARIGELRRRYGKG